MILAGPTSRSSENINQAKIISLKDLAGELLPSSSPYQRRRLLFQKTRSGADAAQAVATAGKIFQRPSTHINSPV